ncbi:unnamed protein product [Caenorhabditis angaria]|uniref:Peptidase M13 C-terminal domain-containing protein n=1 Tax=Caenorhabditis angaria TaxID=860376 RepID=A0A9P1IBR8_9PELO|nr:unnamed protein product [Caenorhabditis angaria]
MKVLFILASIFCVSQATDQYRKYIEQFVPSLVNIKNTSRISQIIDDSVDPCDNFHRHACSNTTTSTLDHAFSEHLNQLLDKTHIKMSNPTLEKFTNVASFYSRRDFTSQLVRHFQKQYLNRCKTNSLDDFLQEVQILYPPSSNCISQIIQGADCQVSSQNFADCFQNFPIELFQQTLFFFVYDAVHLNWIEQYGSVALDNRINSTLQDVKTFALELIKKTPWLQHYADYSSVRKKSDIMPIFEKQSEVYTNCSARSLLRDAPKHVLCLYQIFNHKELWINLQDIRPVIKISDAAGNLHGVLYLYLTYFYISQYISDIAEYMAYTGFTVGHEFGHSIMLSKKSKTKYSEIVRNCVQNQFNRSCSLYEEANCTVLDTQIGDNGADLIGFEISYELFKRQIGDKLHEILFYYAYAAQWCAPYPTEDGLQHQAKVVRTNAVLIQHDEFRKAFGCSDQSKMVQSNNGKCNIFGPDAPQTKSRNLIGF